MAKMFDRIKEFLGLSSLERQNNSVVAGVQSNPFADTQGSARIDGGLVGREERAPLRPDNPFWENPYEPVQIQTAHRFLNEGEKTPLQVRNPSVNAVHQSSNSMPHGVLLRIGTADHARHDAVLADVPRRDFSRSTGLRDLDELIGEAKAVSSHNNYSCAHKLNERDYGR